MSDTVQNIILDRFLRHRCDLKSDGNTLLMKKSGEAGQPWYGEPGFDTEWKSKGGICWSLLWRTPVLFGGFIVFPIPVRGWQAGDFYKRAGKCRPGAWCLFKIILVIEHRL